jgi:hypothetical protein
LVNKLPPPPPPKPHSPTGPLWSYSFPEKLVYSFIYISQASPVKELSDRGGGGKIQSPTTEPHADGKLTNNGGVTWFPKEIIYNTAITTPVPCSLQNNIFHLGLGRPEPQ